MASYRTEMRLAIAPPRFWSKVRVEDSGCWVWIGAITGGGYGNYVSDASRANRRYQSAHRFAYELLVGPIPAGLQLDHLCRNRACCNPDHLEPVTNAENSRRGAKGRMVTSCIHGHAYDEENTGWRKRPGGDRRYCRQCQRASGRARYEAKQATLWRAAA